MEQLHIDNLELCKAEYIEEKGVTDFTFKSKEAYVRIVTKDNDNALIFSTKCMNDKVVLDINVPSDDKVFSKKSLNYCWKLIEMLSSATKENKSDMYIKMLKDYGVSDFVSVKKGICPENYFKYFSWEGEGLINGKAFDHYRIYKGIADMTQKELNDLIEGLKSECKDIGLDTSTPSEVALYG